ncbi:asparaginase [Faecalicoccus sp.]|uniref:asparaginase n=1 Tax=Faecalicoccus sp. TaxID=1971758 RepID=UPI002A820759|nr:asparaginase [Faecalicoccus sp.]MDY5111254.1 asparaginase [Faecalicoccus sp.]
MKNIVIIATGGTIAGSGEAGKSADYAAGKFKVSDILASVPAIQNLAHIQAIQLCNVDSNDMNESRWIELRNLIHQCDKDPQVDGVVVTHGTDTLEETAFFLNLTIHTHMPVVLTGSMRPATAASADGPMNLYQAVALAASDQAKGAGVLAVFSDTIYSGRDIRKSNSYKTDAFEIGHFGSLGYMRDDQVYFLSQSQRPHTLTSPFSDMEIQKLPKVGIVYWHCDADLKILDFMAKEYEGIVTAGSGSGNYGSAWKEYFHKLAKEHVIVRSSRVAQGIVFDSSFFDPERDTISAFTFSPHKARILLMLALMKTRDKQQIRYWFETL